jgi:HSP20 family protein
MTIHTLPISAAIPSISIRREMDRLFDDVFAPRGTTWNPAAEAREDATGYTVTLDIPGVSPETLEVLAEEGVLLVKGTRAERTPDEDERTLFREGARGTFARRFRLPKAADLEQVTATYAHGVLSVRIAKLAPAQPKKVQVSVQV